MDPSQAKRVYAEVSRAHEANPNDVGIRQTLGSLCAWLGDPSRAIQLLEGVVAEDGSRFEAFMSLSGLYLEAEAFQKALVAAERAVALRPLDPRAYVNLAVSQSKLGMNEDAILTLQRAIDIQPDFGPLHLHLGRCLLNVGRGHEALVCMKTALRFSQGPEVQTGLAEVHNHLSNFKAGWIAGAEAVRLAPGLVPARLALADALFGLNRVEEAEAHLREARRLQPGPTLEFLAALAERNAGRMAEAEAGFRRAIEMDAERPASYSGLFHLIKVTDEDRSLVRELERMGQSNPSLSESWDIQFALGKAHEDLGDYERAMGHYDEGNRLAKIIHFSHRPYDHDRLVQQVDRIIRAFPLGSRPSVKSGEQNSDRPIFITGAIRSGTTLAEQILSSHPQVGALGEQPLWTVRSQEALSPHSGELDEPALDRIATDYLALLKKASSARRVTDKMPDNILQAAFIHFALPNARIIQMRRDPLDNAVSMWTTPNSGVTEGGHEKAGIVAYFKEYFRLTTHLQALLPADRFLEVNYEELVESPEETIRRMVDFVGLSWDDACLSPEKNRRTVLTPSVAQVRRPIYQSSVRRSDRFRPWLGELLEIEKPN